MIAADTNILARFYCNDPDDPEAERQQPIARRVMVDSPAIFVPLTVVLELEWVMRGFYEADPASFCDALGHLLGLRHVTVERWEAVSDAVDLHRWGLDFADALH
jgi:predicted nucleic-acid-binding protein